MRTLSKSVVTVIVCCLVAAYCPDVRAQEKLAVVYEKDLLSVDAINVKPEDLFLALGRQCKIEIIAHGNVFPDQPVSITLQNTPVKEAIKTLVRVCGLKNYMMDFKKEKNGSARLAKLDVFMAGAGERVLVKADEKPAETTTMQPSQQPPAKQETENSSSFSKDAKFQWDGSAPINFPEYTGPIPYEASKYAWQDDSKTFTQKTLDIIPPAVRDTMAGALVTTCDDVARERNVQTITPDIVAEATDRLARQANMPPMVMKNLPKTMEDLNRQKIPIAPEQLKEQYR